MIALHSGHQLFRVLVQFCGTVVFVACLIKTTAAQPLGNGQFDVVDAGGLTVGVIHLEWNELTYTEPGGPVYLYRRDPNFDTADGRFVGFYNRALARVLKFPRSGSGYYFTADLDDAFPTDRRSRDVIRPRGVINRNGIGTAGVHGGVVGGRGIGQFHPPVPVLPPIGLPTTVLPNAAMQSRTVPLPDLPPVTVQLVNGGPRDVQVTLLDRKTNQTFGRRIGVGQTQPMTLQRDGGAKIIETYEEVGPLGDVIAQERVDYVPPPVRYELTVHQWRVQSVSIDRTLPGGGVIDDVNIQGRAVGSFPLPSGAALTTGTIDVYRTARAAGNGATIAPLVPDESLPGERVSPLEKAILGLP